MGHINTIIYIIYFNSIEPILFDILNMSEIKKAIKSTHILEYEAGFILIICILSVSNCRSIKHFYIPLCGELITCISEVYMQQS